MNQIPEDCPTCPNRRQGLVIFGKTIDLFELTLQILIVIVIGLPAMKRAWTDEDFGPWQAAGWAGLMLGAMTLVRMAPTDRVNVYKDIFR